MTNKGISTTEKCLQTGTFRSLLRSGIVWTVWLELASAPLLLIGNCRLRLVQLLPLAQFLNSHQCQICSPRTMAPKHLVRWAWQGGSRSCDLSVKVFAGVHKWSMTMATDRLRIIERKTYIRLSVWTCSGRKPCENEKHPKRNVWRKFFRIDQFSLLTVRRTCSNNSATSVSRIRNSTWEWPNMSLTLTNVT